MKLHHTLFTADPKCRKQKKYAENELDQDDDGIVEHEELCKVCEIKCTEKKFTKENEKLVEEGKPAQGKDVLCSWLHTIEDKFAWLKKEHGTGKAVLKCDKPLENLIEAINRLDKGVQATDGQLWGREGGCSGNE